MISTEWFDPDAPPDTRSTGVFTDGACQMKNPRHAGGWGAVYVVDDEVVAELAGGEEPTTNNRMELLALWNGLTLARAANVPVTLYSDSQYALKAMTEWGPGWRRAGWVTAGGTPVKNRDLVEPLLAFWESTHGVRLAWVHGHIGVRWNEYADMLSRKYAAGEL